jgi:hypothetical protein
VRYWSGALIEIFRPRAALQAEILVLRHQLIVLRRKSRSDWRSGTLTAASQFRAASADVEGLVSDIRGARQQPHRQLIDHGHVECVERPPASASGLHTLRSLYH